MSRRRTNPALLVAVLAVLAISSAQAQDATATTALELQLQRQFTDNTVERIESGQLVKAVPVPQARAPAAPPRAAPSNYSTLPALLFAALFLALAAFAAGVLSARKRVALAQQAATPVRLWTDDENNDDAAANLRDELAAQQSLNQTLAAELESLRAEAERADALREQRDDAATQLQAFRLREDDSELEAAQQTIDELRAEIEVIRGAEADLERERASDPGDGGLATSQAELEKRNRHIRELEEVMHSVAGEREALEQSLQARETQLAELQQLVAQRDEQLALAAAELQGLSDNADRAVDARVAELEQELDALRGAQDRVGELRQELAVAREQAAQAQGAAERVADLERQLEVQTAEALRLGDVSAEADKHQRRIEALELELASRLEEIGSLRAEPVELGAPAGLEQQFAATQQHARELEDQLQRQQLRIHELEMALASDEDATAQLELVTPGESADPTYADVQVLKKALDQAEQRILDLGDQLEAAQDELALASGDASPAELQQENVRLSALLVRREHELGELNSRIADLEGQGERMGEWTSTLSSLQNELRRKTHLIDEQSDSLLEDEKRVSELSRELDQMSDRLAASERENESLRELLAQTKALAGSLGEQLQHREDETIRLKLQREPDADPQQPASVTPDLATVDIETLRYTLDGRQDLVLSLETILSEQERALEVATKRVASRDELIVAQENEIAANRVTIAAMQNRLSQAREHGRTTVEPGVGTQRLERELQVSAREMEKLRLDLATWQRRVRPLHEGVVLRDNRIRSMEAELTLLRQAKTRTLVQPPGGVGPAGGGGDAERLECLTQIEHCSDRMRTLEVALAETGERLSRALARDESYLEQLEDLESARAAQLLRIDELHHELESFGVGQGDLSDDNIVDFPARS